MNNSNTILKEDSIKYKILNEVINIKDYLEEQINEEYLCNNCKFLMREPYQTECEHSFCLDCVKNIKECPIDQEKISNFIIRKAQKNKIQNLMINCPINKDKCLWKDKLMELEIHMENCNYKQISCPNNCGEFLIKKEILTLGNLNKKIFLINSV